MKYPKWLPTDPAEERWDAPSALWADDDCPSVPLPDEMILRVGFFQSERYTNNHDIRFLIDRVVVQGCKDAIKVVQYHFHPINYGRMKYLLLLDDNSLLEVVDFIEGGPVVVFEMRPGSKLLKLPC